MSVYFIYYLQSSYSDKLELQDKKFFMLTLRKSRFFIDIRGYVFKSICKIADF